MSAETYCSSDSVEMKHIVQRKIIISALLMYIKYSFSYLLHSQSNVYSA